MKENEEPEDDGGEKWGKSNLRSEAERRASDHKSEKVSSTESLFNKKTTLPVHVKT